MRGRGVRDRRDASCPRPPAIPLLLVLLLVLLLGVLLGVWVENVPMHDRRGAPRDAGARGDCAARAHARTHTAEARDRRGWASDARLRREQGARGDVPHGGPAHGRGRDREGVPNAAAPAAAPAAAEVGSRRDPAAVGAPAGRPAEAANDGTGAC